MLTKKEKKKSVLVFILVSLSMVSLVAVMYFLAGSILELLGVPPTTLFLFLFGASYVVEKFVTTPLLCKAQRRNSSRFEYELTLQKMAVDREHTLEQKREICREKKKKSDINANRFIVTDFIPVIQDLQFSRLPKFMNYLYLLFGFAVMLSFAIAFIPVTQKLVVLFLTDMTQIDVVIGFAVKSCMNLFIPYWILRVLVYVTGTIPVLDENCKKSFNVSLIRPLWSKFKFFAFVYEVAGTTPVFRVLYQCVLCSSAKQGHTVLVRRSRGV